jgi:gliding motility-associated-like protein
MRQPILLLLALFFFAHTGLQAKHIIGGVMTYECLSDGNYQFTLKMYRDCTDPTGAGFDFSAPVTFYKGDSPIPIETIFVSPDQIVDIEPGFVDPCLILPPNVCVQEGTYTFSYQFDEWPSADVYHVAYQRCCRNNTITNLLDPGSVGATFSVDILPSAQAICSSSPVFDDFPPIVICNNTPLEYEHSATDPEGYQLIYELCAPLQGGGLEGTFGVPGDPNGCEGVVPNPACPPPYESVVYNPPYNPLNPLAAEPGLEIDAVTGLLTGTPNALGQFVVGVCVNQFNNGELLGSIRRDFQFNIGSCEPVVFADIEEDSLLGMQDYLLRTCEQGPVTIVNESILDPSIDTYYWSFDLGNGPETFTDFEPSIDFPGPGIYEGFFLINEGSQNCGDTARIQVEIYPELIADFEYEYDTCFAGPVYFQNETEAGAEVTDWIWYFGDGTFDGIASPVHQYMEPGDRNVTLAVTDINGCEDQITRPVEYFPVPGLILVSPNDVVSCPPATITFNNLSNPIDDTYTLEWDFGDGGTDTVISPTYTFQEDGIFSVSLKITSPIGCETDTVFTDLIEIQPSPIADFDYQPKFLSNLQPDVTFIEEAIDAVHWDWYINGRRVSDQPEFEYMFQDTGYQEVTLLVTHEEGCTDTLTQYIDVLPEIRYFMPNAFTPNYDNVNDFFGFAGVALGITDYQLVVWDRWGGVVFETNDPFTYWNGQHLNQGRLAQDGVYVWVASFTGPRGKTHEYKGFVTLMR